MTDMNRELVDGELVDDDDGEPVADVLAEDESTALAKVQPDADLIAKTQPRMDLTLHNGVELMPVETQATVLAEYDERQSYFLDYVRSKFKRGTHYGFPPGCAPKQANGDWVAKPSLYQAGARLIVGLFRLRTRYDTDAETWRMLGEPAGTVCMLCELVDSNREVVGRGRGTYEVNEKKGMGRNATVKLAQKRALVNAAFDFRPELDEIFGQDGPEQGTDRLTLDEQKRLFLDEVEGMRDGIKGGLADAAWAAKVVRAVTGASRIVTEGALNAVRKAALVDRAYDLATAEPLPALPAPSE